MKFSWKSTLCVLALSTTAYYLKRVNASVEIPFLPIGTIGTAVAFYLGFKNNSSYDRLWEARKIWGEITNLCRTLASYVIACSPPELPVEVSDIINRQILFANVLKAQLRKNMVWENTLYASLSKRKNNRSYEEELTDALSACTCSIDRHVFEESANSATQILHRQMVAIRALKDQGVINANECSDLMKMCAELVVQQGNAERIKDFPFPRQYAYFSELFVYIFVALLPFGLIPEFEKLNAGTTWLSIPFTVLVGWVFITMDRIGDTSENPFENGVYDIPLNAICRQIEVDLKQMQGKTDLPAPILASNNVLM